jgi:hypothetical protein
MMKFLDVEDRMIITKGLRRDILSRKDLFLLRKVREKQRR